jgi:hypothetical protein
MNVWIQGGYGEWVDSDWRYISQSVRWGVGRQGGKQKLLRGP